MLQILLFLVFASLAFGQCGQLVINPVTLQLNCTGTAGGSGTVTSVGLAGTANEITVTGSSPITASGSWVLSFPAGGVTLPGTTTASVTTQSAGDNTTKAASTAFVTTASTGTGFIWLFGGPPDSVLTLAPAPGANGGIIYEFSTTTRTSTQFIYTIATPGAGGSKVLFGVWGSTLTAPICVTSQGSNAGGVHALTWASGSGVSGGTCAMPNTSLRLVVTSEDTTLGIAAYDGGTYLVGYYTVDNVGGASTANNRGGYVTSGVSTGSGGTLAFVSDLSAITWTSTSGAGQIPAVVIR